MVRELLPPQTTVLENYIHPNVIYNETKRSLELDIYVPSYKLAM